MHDTNADVRAARDILQRCACHKVRLAARAVTRAYDAALRPSGLRATQLAVLAAVAAAEAISIAALATELGMDRSTLKRNLAPLEEARLVRLGDEGWRRSRTLEITSPGRRRLLEALPLWRKAQQDLRRKLDEEHWSIVHAGLEHLSRVT